MNAATLTPEIDALVSAARALPPALVRQVAEFAEFLGKKHAVDKSDEWSDDLRREFTLAAIRRFEAEHPEDDWGTDYTTPGGP